MYVYCVYFRGHFGHLGTKQCGFISTLWLFTHMNCRHLHDDGINIVKAAACLNLLELCQLGGPMQYGLQ